MSSGGNSSSSERGNGRGHQDVQDVTLEPSAPVEVPSGRSVSVRVLLTNHRSEEVVFTNWWFGASRMVIIDPADGRTIGREARDFNVAMAGMVWPEPTLGPGEKRVGTVRLGAVGVGVDIGSAVLPGAYAATTLFRFGDGTEQSTTPFPVTVIEERSDGPERPDLEREE